MNLVSISIEFCWQPLGEVKLDDMGMLVFPKASTRPGLYRFDFEFQDRPATYIGESDQIIRRLQHYRTPGPSQRTNLRLNKAMRETLAEGCKVSVATVTGDIEVDLGELRHHVDLNRKLDRVLLEHAAILTAYSAGLIIMNA